jgi:serine/threonine protein kinase
MRRAVKSPAFALLRNDKQLYLVSLTEVLGAGAYGKVYGGVQVDAQRRVAIKMTDAGISQSKAELLRREGLMLRNIRHPGIVQCYQVFEANNRIFVVLERLHSDVFTMIVLAEGGKISERATKFVTSQVG